MKEMCLNIDQNKTRMSDAKVININKKAVLSQGIRAMPL